MLKLFRPGYIASCSMHIAWGPQHLTITNVDNLRFLNQDKRLKLLLNYVILPLLFWPVSSELCFFCRPTLIMSGYCSPTSAPLSSPPLCLVPFLPPFAFLSSVCIYCLVLPMDTPSSCWEESEEK